MNNQGYWINYKTGKIFRIDDHIDWIRRWPNARKLGIKKSLYDKIFDIDPVDDREKALLLAMNNASIIRVRAHGTYVTFEFSDSRSKAAIESIWMWGLDFAGDFTLMNVINFKTKKKLEMLFKDFKEYFDEGREDAIMENAYTFVIKNNFKQFFQETA